ncbi:hypothetical protein P154DRAFT_338462 [Amniculicola lignicola CBS 123094]|uniref:Uncharacterized protein n=1 Tax=Amniculicola lignicola CBS 123094 TaxID=1392246 RepID=A0A6A5WUT3_9PLEO|nr:hypothetical protein P154DRAFT_338462 [Amniculicola lignicola CBS 123094]
MNDSGAAAAPAPVDSHATGTQIHPLLRQRMLNRAATFSEGASPLAPPLPRRRSSALSEYSDTRHSFRSSTDNPLRATGGKDMDALTSSDEPTFWHSAPLAFAILPAACGLFFQNGGSVVTDVLLLGFASMFLNWCVRSPWDWYHAAQRIHYVEPDDDFWSDTIVEEDGDGEHTQEEERSSTPDPISASEPAEPRSRKYPQKAAQDAAYRELRREEIFALLACFVGPFLGAYMLHAIRSQLTRPSEGLVSNYNLTIFVMAAELRPFSHLIKMKQARMVHLQRVVRKDSTDKIDSGDAQELVKRLVEVEARLSEPTGNSDFETMKVSSAVRQSLQPQLDALNRAVRRYEKRQAAQSIQIEARFGELETRLKDALSLAAAAARTGQYPSMFSMVVTWVVSCVTYGLQTCWAVLTYPLRVTNFIAAEAKSWFVKTERQSRKRLKGQSNGYGSAPTPRIQSRSGK